MDSLVFPRDLGVRRAQGVVGGICKSRLPRPAFELAESSRTQAWKSSIWSSLHGLLGVFHHSTVQIDDPGCDRKWTLAGDHWDVSAGALRPSSPLALTTNLDYGISILRAGPYLSKFIVRDLQGPLPAPDSEEFFKLYGEPLHNWIVALIILAEAISLEDWDTLNKLISSVARVRWFSEKRIGSQIAFPSLLCAFAEMYFQDIEDGSRLGPCACCGELFVSGRKWAEYCSRGCAAKKRQQRFLQESPEYYMRRDGRRTTTVSKKGKL